MRLVLVLIALAALGVFVAFAVFVRVAPSRAEEWHVDPMEVSGEIAPNAYLVAPDTAHPAPIYAVPPDSLAVLFDQMVRSAPRTQRLAGSTGELWMTYIQRSAVMGFPDYISVRVLPLEGGATLAIYSRARFGRFDLGVNEARVRRWLASLETLAPLDGA